MDTVDHEDKVYTNPCCHNLGESGNVVSCKNFGHLVHLTCGTF
jgi:hypothetical protein